MKKWLTIGLAIAALQGGGMAAASMEPVRKVRLTWDAVPNAVMYELAVTKGARQERVVRTRNEIYSTGYELDTSLLQIECDDLHWSVRALDVKKHPLTDFSAPKPLKKEPANPKQPEPTTQFDKMAYAKLYPVYSWIPVLKASKYEIQVYYDTDDNPATRDRLIKTDYVDGQTSDNYYDETSYVGAGTYWWHVRALNAAKSPMGEWSERRYFKVKDQNIAVAALGDSITHGGGAISTPPSYALYDWETYAGLPILNLGLSGNTVERMVERFDHDVLAFHPRVLVIFGGINNLRAGDKSWQVITGLNRLKYKCLFNDITPVFVTVAPVNPRAMREVSGIQVTNGWETELREVNQWIRRQSHYVDITPPLTDKKGWLREELAADGLHPDADGKRMIGEAIGAYIAETFQDVLSGNERHKVIK